MGIGVDYTEIREKLRQEALRESETYRFKKALAKYAEIVVTKDTLQLSNQDLEDVAKAWQGKADHKTILRLRRYLKVDEIQKRADNAIITLLVSNNLGQEKPFQLLEQAITIAQSKENADLLRKIALDLIELHALRPKETKVTETREYEQHQLTENAEKALQESKTARAKQVTESTKQG